MRKILSLLLMAVYIISAYAYDVEINGIYYNEKSSLGKTVKVTSAPSSNPYTGLIVIPASINVEGTTYKVVEIEDSAFNNCSNINTVIIGKNVTHVGINSFNNCTALSQLIIEDSDEEMHFEYSRETQGSWPYEYENRYPQFKNSPIKTLYIGRYVTSYYDTYYQNVSAFQNNTTIESVEFGNTVIVVGQNLLTGCTNLKEISFGKNISTIKDCAFLFCGNISSIILPSSLKVVGESAFSYCDLKDLYIPASVDSIANLAFANNFNLNSITLSNNPNLLLGDQVFGSGERKTVKCEKVITHTKVPLVLAEVNHAFSNFAPNASLFVPRGCVDIYKSATGWSQFKEILEDPDDVSDILVSSIKLDKFYISINEGEEITLNATILPENATNKKLKWVSSDNNIATVLDGKVSAIKEGVATVTASSTDGSDKSSSCTISVNPCPYLPGDVNGDNTIDISDINILINIILGKESANKYNNRADVTSDGVVDVSDINTLINCILGK